MFINENAIALCLHTRKANGGVAGKEATSLVVSGSHLQRRTPAFPTAAICVTIEHEIIRSWAKLRGARPSRSEGEGRPYPLLFDFGPPDAGVVEISWKEYFCEFERVGLAFVYRDTGPAGELDDFHRLVHRCTVPQLVVSGRSTIMIDWP